MANNQTRIPKKPRMGAITLFPLDINTIRRVSIVTSTILVANINNGRIRYRNKAESKNEVSINSALKLPKSTINFGIYLESTRHFKDLPGHFC
jgi:hypothetical protein